MAARAKRPRPSVLTDEQLERAHSLYLYERPHPVWIARHLGVTPGCIDRASEDGQWECERLNLVNDPATIEARRERDAARAAARAMVERLGAQWAVQHMRGQLAVARKAARLAEEASTPQEIAAAARVLGPVGPSIQGARLSVDLSTEKTAIEGAQESYDAVVERLIAAGLAERDDGAERQLPTTADAGDDVPVVPGSGVDAAPGPAKGSSPS